MTSGMVMPKHGGMLKNNTKICNGHYVHTHSA